MLDGYLVVRDIVIYDCLRRLLFLSVLVLLWFVFNVWFQHFKPRFNFIIIKES